MIEGLRADGAVLVVDAGNLYFGKGVLSERDRPQQVEKARLLAETHAIAGIDGMLPGVGDLALGIPLVQELAATYTLPYVAANLECGGAHPFPASLSVERSGVTFTVIGVVGNALKEPSCHASEPGAAVRAAIEAAPPGVIVVLSGQKVEEDEALSAANPRISLVVNGQERQQLESPKALPNGGLLLAAGSRGKQLGVLSFTYQPGVAQWRDARVLVRFAEQRESYRKRGADLEKRVRDAADDASRERLGKQAAFMDKKLAELDVAIEAAAAAGGPANAVQNELVDLGTNLADHPATAALVARAKERIAAAEPLIAISAVATGPFAGSSACTGCHAAQAAQWSTTEHSRAWATLVAAGSERDRACFSCHVTGALHPDGPHDPGAVAGLESVGCESCHGPGKAHVANPPSVEMIAHPDEALCRGCHDGKQDEGRFEPSTYLPRVVH